MDSRPKNAGEPQQIPETRGATAKHVRSNVKYNCAEFCVISYYSLSNSSFIYVFSTALDDPIRKEEMVSLIENLVNYRPRRRGVNIMGECLGTTEGVLKLVMYLRF